jgi:hypothetical protein
MSPIVSEMKLHFLISSGQLAVFIISQILISLIVFICILAGIVFAIRKPMRKYNPEANLVFSPCWPSIARIILTLLLVLLILLIAFSRIYLRVHYTSDVLAGFIIGLCWLLISLFVNRKAEQFSEQSDIHISSAHIAIGESIPFKL